MANCQECRDFPPKNHHCLGTERQLLRGSTVAVSGAFVGVGVALELSSVPALALVGIVALLGTYLLHGGTIRFMRA